MLNKIEYEQQKLIAKFINKISKINKTSICLTIIILYYYLSDDCLLLLITTYLIVTYLVTKLILHFKTKFSFKIYIILNNFIYFFLFVWK